MDILKKHYKDVIYDFIEANASTKGYKGKMAKASGCSSSYFSQVLNSHNDLTLDQVNRLADFWGLTEDRKDYFTYLFLQNRASTQELREYFGLKMTILRERLEGLGAVRRRTNDKLTEDGLLFYYSSWCIPAIHIVTSIGRYQKVGSIAKALSLPEQTVSLILNRLQDLGLVKQKNNSWVIDDVNIHSRKNSLSSVANHKNWRFKCIEVMNSLNTNDLHYSGIHSLSLSRFEKIKFILEKLIIEERENMLDSEEEVLVNFNVDFYRLA